MTKPSVPEQISPDVLRDHATPARVDRLWRRIEQDLPTRHKRRPGGALLWAPAVALCTFAAGIFVGAQWFAAEAPPPRVVTLEPAPVAEPAAGISPAPASSHSPERRKKRTRVQKPPSQKTTPASAVSAAPLPEAIEVEAEEPVTIAPPEWQQLADDGLYIEALAAVEQLGGFDAVLTQATAEQLMLLVDVARGTGQRERAVVALRRVVSQHGSDPNAPVAAWMLGNELVKAGDAQGAAQAFAMYRALSPQGDFAEDALARQFEVAMEQADLERARRYADQYAKDFPDGPRGEDIRAQLAELQQRQSARVSETDVPTEEGVEVEPVPSAEPLAPPAADSDD